MTEIFRYSLLGVGAGGLYALAAIGLVLVYRGSGVVNFAQAAMGLVGAYAFYVVRIEQELPAAVAVAAGLVASAALGAAFHLLVMRRMAEASNLARIVATLALLVAIQSTTSLVYGPLPRVVPSMLPTDPVEIFGVAVGWDRAWILVIVLVLTTLLWAVYRWTTFGVATSAVAENPRAAAALAVSPNMVAAANWAIGAALGALAAILLVPITGLGPANITLIVIPVLAAAVVGRFTSFPVTTATGIAIGIAQALVTRYVTTPGWATAVPFVLVTVVLLVRGSAVAGKDERFGRMPALGTGRLAPGLVATGAVLSLIGIWLVFPADWLEAFQIQLVIAVVLLSFVVVTGYGGQMSLAQMGFAGMGALVAGFLVDRWDWSLELAALGGIAAVVPIGVVVGLAGIRTRGVNLAIVTLGLAISIEAVVLGNPHYNGGILGYRAEDLTFLGVAIDRIGHPERYATLSLLVLVLVGLAVANLRRGRAGRRLIAVRTNERAAAALGISVLGAKLYAFVLGACIAAVGGMLLAFRNEALGFGEFAGFQSILTMQYAVLGGVGVLGGPVVGSSLYPGTTSQQAMTFLGSDAGIYSAIGASLVLLAMLTIAPDGLAVLIRKLCSGMLRVIRRRAPRAGRTAAEVPAPVTVAPRALRIESLRVRFGGTTALDAVSFEVHPGEVVGLIGPNGAGKSTAIEAITGFVTPTGGTVTLGDSRIDGWKRERRARHGLSRSFQSLELFDDLTVRENLLAACDRRDAAAYATDLVHPGEGELPDVVGAVVADFGLTDALDSKAAKLSYAERRMLAVARAVAGGQSVLLLDEPASGLDDRQARRLGTTIRRMADERGVAVLLVEHNVDMVLRSCDRVYALDFGHLIGSGTPAEIRRNPAVVDAYLGTAGGEEEPAPVP